MYIVYCNDYFGNKMWKIAKFKDVIDAEKMICENNKKLPDWMLSNGIASMFYEEE